MQHAFVYREISVDTSLRIQSKVKIRIADVSNCFIILKFYGL